MATRSELFSLLTCPHTTTNHIGKYLLSILDNWYKNLEDNTVLACELFSGCCPVSKIPMLKLLLECDQSRLSNPHSLAVRLTVWDAKHGFAS